MSKIANLNKRINQEKSGVKKSSHVLDLREVVKKREQDKQEQKVSIFKNFFSPGGKKNKKIINQEIDQFKKLETEKINKQEIKKLKDQEKERIKKEKEIDKINKQEIKRLKEQEREILKKEKNENAEKERIKKTEKQEIKNISKQSLAGPICPFRLSYSFTNIAIFLLFASIFILPIKGMAYIKDLQQKAEGIIGYASNGAKSLKNIKNAGLESDLSSFSSDFAQAQESFSLAQKQVDRINQVAQVLIKIVPRVGDTFSSGEKVLALGENISSAGKFFATGFSVFSKDYSGDKSVSAKLNIIQKNLSLALKELHSAEKIVGEINVDSLPVEHRADIAKIQTVLPQAVPLVEKILNYLEVLQQIIGKNEMKRYLLVFQNNNEIRASGGFIGSYALLDINNGEIVNLEIPAGGSYDLKAGETENIIAPHPLWLINPHWHFWDANWFFDFPASAEKLTQFYNSSGGPTVDGVIAINATLMQELVSSLGSIKVDGYDYEVTGENFINILQQESDKKKEEARPKEFLSLVGPVIIDKMMNNPESWVKMLPVLNKGLKQKDLQFYFTSYDLQKEIIDLGWSGRVLDADKDYLSVVHSSLTGGKTDQVIKSEILHKTNISDLGEVEDTLIITRTHQGVKGDIFTGVDNNDYMRIYVPIGSRLISARGFSSMPLENFQHPADGYKNDEVIAKIEDNTFVDETSGTEIFTESGKTVFANWLQLKPGETKSVYLKYKLPFVIKKNVAIEDDSDLMDHIGMILNPGLQTMENENHLTFYSLLVQKQSGVNNVDFIKSIEIPADYDKKWSYPAIWQTENEKNYKTSTALDRDILQVVVFE